MNKKKKVQQKTPQVLRVISQTSDSVKVLLPSIEIPVEMTTKYFNYLQSTGAYMILYCVANSI